MLSLHSFSLPLQYMLLKKYPPAEVSHLKEAAAAAANDGKVCSSSSLKEKRAAPAETNEVAQKPKSPWSTTPEVRSKASACSSSVVFSSHFRVVSSQKHIAQDDIMQNWLMSYLMIPLCFWANIDRLIHNGLSHKEV